MKLLFVITKLELGGAQRVMLSLADALSEKHDVTIVSLKHPDQSFPSKSLKVQHLDDKVRVNQRILRFLRHYFGLKKIVNAGDFDCILSFLPEANFIVGALATKANKVLHVRNDPKHEYQGMYHLLMRWIYPRADHLIVQNDLFMDFFKPYVKNIIVIPNPVNMCPDERIHPEKRIVNVGRFVPQKDQLSLIEAFLKLAQSYPDWSLHLYGEGPLEAQFSSVHHPRIHIHPPTLDIQAVYRSAGLFVLSSRYEGMPNVLLEAMASGVPCISTRYGDAVEAILHDGSNGILVPVGNVSALAEAIKRLLDDDDYRQKLGNAARGIRDKYSFERYLARYQSLLEHLDVS